MCVWTSVILMVQLNIKLDKIETDTRRVEYSACCSCLQVFALKYDAKSRFCYLFPGKCLCNIV